MDGKYQVMESMDKPGINRATSEYQMTLDQRCHLRVNTNMLYSFSSKQVYNVVFIL